MKFPRDERAFSKLKRILDEREVAPADLGVVPHQVPERAFAHGDLRGIRVDLGIEAALVHVVVQHVELSLNGRSV